MELVYTDVVCIMTGECSLGIVKKKFDINSMIDHSVHESVRIVSQYFVFVNKYKFSIHKLIIYPIPTLAFPKITLWPVRQ